jgi:hypothetical protein
VAASISRTVNCASGKACGGAGFSGRRPG